MSRGKSKSKWQKSGKTNRHHLRPKSRGGDSVESNLLRIDVNRHNAWHFLFNNLTLDEIIALLIRLKKAKEAKKFRQVIS